MYKKIVLSLLLWMLLLSAFAQKGLPLAGKRVLIVGASITQQGDYVNFISYYLNKIYPKQKFDIISIGLASETVSGLTEKQHPFPRPNLLNRLPNSLQLVKPDVVIACDYGLNDGIYHPENKERFDAFKKGVHQLIKEVKAANAQLVLLTPEPFDSLPVKSRLPVTVPDFAYFAPYAGYDAVMKDYAKWELGLNEPGVKVIDIHQPVNDYLKDQRKTNATFSFGGDGIHPNKAGHLLMAQTILKALHVPFKSKGLTADLDKILSDSLYVLIAKQREVRSDGWLPYVGYTRDKRVKSNDIDSTEKYVAALQLNIEKLRQNKIQ